MKVESGYDRVRMHVLVHGVVQGVFFRTTIRSRAQILGIRGWVKNTASGGVEAVFEGEKDSVNEILDFCKRGPEGSVITDVRVEEEPFRAEFTGFEIRH